MILPCVQTPLLGTAEPVGAPCWEQGRARGWAGQMLVEGPSFPAAHREPDPGRVLVSARQFMERHPEGTRSLSGLAGAHSCPPPLTMGSPKTLSATELGHVLDEFPG